MAKNKLKKRHPNPFGSKKRKSQEQIEKRNKVIMGVFISVIMVGSMLGIFLSGNSSNSSELSYTNILGETFNFAIGPTYYSLETENGDINFYFHPYDLTNFENDTGKISQITQNNQIVFLFDPEDKNIVYLDIARFDLTNELLKNNKFIVGARTENTTNYETLPILSCENASKQIPFIYFKTGNESKIIYENNCLIMEGNEYDFLRYRDLIIYTEQGIMP